MAGYSNTASNSAARAYANVGLESAIASAHPHRLIHMLFEGAILAIARARGAMHASDISAIAIKGQSISKAIQIIDEGLKAAIVDNDGNSRGDSGVNSSNGLAGNLRALYDYMARRLLLASLKNDPGALDEVTRLLTELKDAWHAIEPSHR